MLLIAIFLNLLIATTEATKPCSSDSYFGKSERSLEEWIGVSKWVAIVEINKINHKWGFYGYCNMEYKSTCAQKDFGSLDLNILKIIKGHLTNEIKLTPASCSKDLPDKLGIYIFYGNYDGYYAGYELVREL